MALTVTVDGNDLTDFLQDRSLSAKLNSCDFTLIDPSSVPAINDVVALTDPTWSGAVNSIETVGYEGNVPFYKVRATNTDVLVDGGAASFNLSDAPNGSTTFGFKGLSVHTQLQGATTEVRAKCIVFEPGLTAGEEIDLTSVAHGYTAETFTIMDLTTEYPTEDGPTYALDLGLGDFATATTGADDGGPLSPISLTDGIIDVVTDAGCCDDGGGGGGGASSDGITDDFNRTVAADSWGTATCGLTWQTLTDSRASSSVTGDMVEVELDIAIGNIAQVAKYLEGDWRTLYNRVRSVEFRFDSTAAGSSLMIVGGKMCGIYFEAVIDVKTPGPYSTFGFPGSTTTSIPSAFWVAGRTYTVTQVDDGTNVTNTLSDGTTTYTVAKGSPATYASFNDVYLTAYGETTGTAQVRTIYFDNLDVPEVTRNSVDAATGRRPVHIEYTTLTALSGTAFEDQTADTYYDYEYNTGSVTDLEAIGFTTSDDITFTATRPGLVSVLGEFVLDASPATTGFIYMAAPGTMNSGLGYKFGANDTTAIPLSSVLYFATGDFIKLSVKGSVGEQPTTYATITLARLD